ncbi:hypothetical protein ACFZAU_29950 [Streptomyces sp. NPDC008238]
MRAAPDEQWHDTEEVVRRLLRDGVPRPATPGDRMRQIRRRVRQRRRRRATAAGAVTALTAVVACFLLLPGPRPPGDAHSPAAAPDRRSALPAATPSPSPAATRSLTTVRLLEETALTLTVPRGWDSLSVGDDGWATGFVSSQPLSRPPDGSCPDGADGALLTCRPLKALEEGGVLMAFQPAATGKAGLATPLRVGEPSPAGKGCRILLGDTELTAWGHGRSTAYGKPFEVRVDVCLRAPSDATLTAVTDALTTAFPRVDG